MACKRRRRNATRTAIDITALGTGTMVGGITVGHIAGVAPSGARLPTGTIYSGLGLMPVAGVIMAGGAVVRPLKGLERKYRKRKRR